MSSSPNRASQQPGKARRKDASLDLNTARQMLPLVRGIVSEIVDTHQRLSRLVPEQDRLERNRRTLDWSARQRRYALNDEIDQTEKNLTAAIHELDALGIALVDSSTGRVDFPTRINGRAAAFSWQLGEDALTHWCYKGEAQRRIIPTDWQPGTPLRVRSEP